MVGMSWLPGSPQTATKADVGGPVQSKLPAIPYVEASKMHHHLKFLVGKMDKPQALQDYKDDTRKFYWEVLFVFSYWAWVAGALL